MTLSQYKIMLYTPELVHRVAGLLHTLFGGDLDINTSYLRWKYHDNPYSEKPLGIAAFHKGEVVGFRGYFPTKWQLPGGNDTLIVLGPGDTYVRPDHRKKGLSVAMGETAMEEFASYYRVFLNTSAVRTSVPGYLKMGFVPIADKTYLMKYNLLYLVMKKFFETADRSPEVSKKRSACGTYDNIIIAESPKPKEMSGIISCRAPQGNRITLFQDEEFFRWRFSNKRNRYLFYYLLDDNIITGYLVILLLQNNRFGYVLDFAGSRSGAVSVLLRHMVQKKPVDIIAIPHISLSEDFSQMLRAMRFRADSLIEHRLRKSTGVCPFLVRPVKNRCVENDWYIGGLDIRQVGNWHIKGICNDGF